MNHIIERILPIFSRNYPLESRGAIWDNCMSIAMKVELNESSLENMFSTPLVCGFKATDGSVEIARLAEALGVCGILNPEGLGMLPACNLDKWTSEEILGKIQEKLSWEINFPPFNGNCLQGLSTKYGISTNRHIFYLWVLKKIIDLCPDRSVGIIEIGAGVGILGYYLDKAGYQDYTTIDLALVNACQTYFLARNLPDRKLVLSGDSETPFDLCYKDSLKLLHVTDFKQVPKNRFSIMVNMDGLTEYGIEEATKYVQSDCAPVLLSINHEVNPYRVYDLPQPRKLEYRYPFWLRAGYVEELFVVK